MTFWKNMLLHIWGSRVSQASSNTMLCLLDAGFFIGLLFDPEDDYAYPEDRCKSTLKLVVCTQQV
jgi:hypothetical protein